MFFKGNKYSEIWALKFKDKPEFVPPIDSPSIEHEDCFMCFFTKDDADLGCEHQKNVYDIDCVPVKIELKI